MKKVLSKQLFGWEENLQTIKDSDDFKAKHAILTEAVKTLFNTISIDDLLKENSKKEWLFEDRILHASEVEDIKLQALQFTNSSLWRVLQKDIKYQANKAMFEKSQSELDLAVGKMLLFFNDIINTRLSKMK